MRAGAPAGGGARDGAGLPGDLPDPAEVLVTATDADTATDAATDAVTATDTDPDPATDTVPESCRLCAA